MPFKPSDPEGRGFIPVGGADEEKNIARKVPFVEQTVLQAEQAQRDVNNLPFSAQPLTGAQTKSDLAFAGAQRQSVAYAADRGLITSNFLDQQRRQLLQQQALANAGLHGQAEENWRRQAAAAGQEVATVQQAREKIPEKTAGVGHVTDKTKGITDVLTQKLFVTDRDQIDAANAASQRALNEITKARPTEQQLQSGLAQHIDDIYAQHSQALVADMQRRGFSAAAIAGYQKQLANDATNAKTEMVDVARALSGPDPAQAQAMLSALYAPDRMPVIQQQNVNPMFGIVGGVAGGIIGGVYGGGPAGASAGYGIGSGAGNMVGEAVS